MKGSGSGWQTGGTATRATSSAARGGRRAHQQATASGTRATWRRVRGEGRFKDTLGRGTKRVNDDEPGNEDVPPHHHGKLTTRTTTRHRCSEAQDNRRAWRRRGRARLHRPAAADCRISDSGWRTQVATAARLMVADGRQPLSLVQISSFPPGARVGGPGIAPRADPRDRLMRELTFWWWSCPTSFVVPLKAS